MITTASTTKTGFQGIRAAFIAMHVFAVSIRVFITVVISSNLCCFHSSSDTI